MVSPLGQGASRGVGFYLTIRLFRLGINKAGTDVFFLETIVRLSARTGEFEFFHQRTCHTSLRNVMTWVPHLHIGLVLGAVKTPGHTPDQLNQKLSGQS